MPCEWVAMYEKKKIKYLVNLTKINYALYKHLRAHIKYLEMYGEWACIHEFNNTD